MIFLHIGTHKTGSKSLQRFLFDHAAELAAGGYDLYTGYHRSPTNHRELLLASLRVGRESLATYSDPGVVGDHGYFQQIAARVRGFVKSSSRPHQIFTAEDLSHLRFPDEMARLKRILGVPSSEICAIVYLRNKEEFLRSYKQQILKRAGRAPSSDRSSPFYVGDDTWLADYEALISAYRERLGCRVVSIDYDRQVAARGNIIPSFLETLSLDPDTFGWNDYFLHSSSGQSDELREVRDGNVPYPAPESAMPIPPGSLIFIVGHRRSGTTLVNNMLCSDPQANPQIGEAQPLTHLLNAFRWSADNFDRMTRHYLPTRTALDEFAAATSRQLLRSCWETQGRPRHLVLKNPELSAHIDWLHRCFPDARFVVCVRDPRDQIASERDVVARRESSGALATKFSAVALSRKYRQTVESMVRAADGAPDAFCFVRYEDLVSDAKRVAERLGAFCGLDLGAFDPSADWARMAVKRDELSQRPSFSPLYGRPVSAARVGRFRERLSSEEVAKIEAVTAEAMARFGYPSAKRLANGAFTSADTEYVMIAEAGTLERQALMLAESIRSLPGVAGQAAITVVSPRPDRRPGKEVLRRLEELAAEYLALEVDSPCPYYGTSFKLAAMAAVENRGGPSILVMLDSDTLFLAAPTFDLGQRGVALRPVDVKGMCTTGPDDLFDEYWRRLCEVCAVAYDDIPWVQTSADGVRVKASHNGGLVAANRRDGLFTTSDEFLRRSVAADLFPRPNGARVAGHFRTGAGQSSPLGRRIWGAAQAALSLALLARGLEARILPPTYNVPCHYFDRVAARCPEVASEPVHAHYHWLCDADELAANPLLDGRMKVPTAARKLLARHMPLDQPPTLGRRLMQFVSAAYP